MYGSEREPFRMSVSDACECLKLDLFSLSIVRGLSLSVLSCRLLLLFSVFHVSTVFVCLYVRSLLSAECVFVCVRVIAATYIGLFFMPFHICLHEWLYDCMIV